MGVLLFFLILYIIFSIISYQGDKNGGGVFQLAQRKIGFNIRIIQKSKRDSNGKLHEIRDIEGNGAFPLSKSMDTTFVTHVFDITDDPMVPVYSIGNDFTSKDSSNFEFVREAGILTPSHKTVDWASLAIIPIELLIPPYSGPRTLKVTVSMVDTSHFRTSGFDAKSAVWTDSLKFLYNFRCKGYKEYAEDRDKSREIALQLAIAIAGADGEYTSEEGKVIKEWILDRVNALDTSERESRKKIYNRLVKEAFTQIQEGTLSVSALTEQLNELDDEHVKHEAIDLCYKVLAADGKADTSEMKMIHSLAEVLKLNMDDVIAVRDRRLIGIDMVTDTSADIEEILGVQKDWDIDKKKKHIRMEFQKWNNRVAVLPPGTEREHAQQMLDKVAEARKRYV